MIGFWPAGFGLEWPAALLLLPLPLILLRARASEPVRPPALPPRLARALAAASRDGPPRGKARLPLALAGLGWCALVLAAAQPFRVGEAVAQPVSGRAMMLAVDLSSSMERQDFSLDGERLDRFEAVRRVALDFIERRRGDRVGLVLFGEKAFVAAPLTLDVEAVAAALGEAAIGMAGRSTAIGDALGLSLAKLRDDPAGEKAVVLLSDGTNNAGTAEPEDAAALAAGLNIRVHAIGMASEGGTGAGDPAADLDETTLRAVAERSGGKFFRARSLAELATVYGAIDALERAAGPVPPLLPKEDWRNPLVLMALLSFAALSLARARA